MKSSVYHLVILFLLEFNLCTGLIFYNDEDSRTFFLNSNQTELISIISSNKNVEFSLVSVHSQQNNVTLSYDDLANNSARPLKRNRKISGLNVGLVVLFDQNYPKRSYVYLKNENKLKFRVFIKILQFDGYYPIPGACNLEFPVLISPFLKLKTTELNSVLDFQKASLGSNFLISKDKHNCDFSNNKLNYEIYSYYLKENDYSEHEYFLALNRMSSVNLIETYGTRLDNQIFQPKTRVKLLAYRGKGVVYSVVVSFLNFKTAYTPVVSYDCNLKDSNSCRTYRNYFQLIYFLFSGLFGLIICLDSSKCAKLEVLYFAFIIGTSISYVFTSKYPQINLIDNFYATVLIVGLIFGSICFAVWLRYSSIDLILSGTHFGFLLISIILSSNIYQFKYSITYGIFIALAFVLIPVFSIFIDNHKLNTICCSVSGSYMFVVSIEQFFNGSLIYIVLNTINSLIYKDLYLMESNLPFQAIDYLSSFIWFILLGLSLFLNLFTKSDFSMSKSILNSLRCLFDSFKSIRRTPKSHVKKYEEIETIDSKEEDISKYNELSRSIIGSLNNLDKENDFCNTSFNSNSKYSSPIIKRRINSSSTKIDLPSTPSLSRCSTPRRSQCSNSSVCSTPKLNQVRLDHLDCLNNQLTPNNLLKNVVIQNAKHSTVKNRF